MKRKFHWISHTTGEIQENIVGVFKSIYEGRKYYHFWNLRWEYSRAGF